MSQCITFCPEQTDWKGIINEREEPVLQDANKAAKLFLQEDGFQTGLLYEEQRATWPPASTNTVESGAMARLAASFRV
jgi:2-oxoglutarate ferredoxin oxidoreductase subunit beta